MCVCVDLRVHFQRTSRNYISCKNIRPFLQTMHNIRSHTRSPWCQLYRNFASLSPVYHTWTPTASTASLDMRNGREGEMAKQTQYYYYLYWSGRRVSHISWTMWTAFKSHFRFHITISQDYIWYIFRCVSDRNDEDRGREGGGGKIDWKEAHLQNEHDLRTIRFQIRTKIISKWVEFDECVYLAPLRIG